MSQSSSEAELAVIDAARAHQAFESSYPRLYPNHIADKPGAPGCAICKAVELLLSREGGSNG